jgi:enediyne biosynthesis thioesterase
MIGFEETNLVGNVYYVNHLRWQGRCREMFLREHAPELVGAIADGLCLATTQCRCEYYRELEPFDRIIVRMRLGDIRQNRILMLFDYLRETAGGEDLVARGEQQIAVMRRDGARTVPTPIPPALLSALAPYLEARRGEGECHVG